MADNNTEKAMAEALAAAQQVVKSPAPAAVLPGGKPALDKSKKSLYKEVVERPSRAARFLGLD